MLRVVVSAAAVFMIAVGFLGIRQALRAGTEVPSKNRVFPGMPIAGWQAILWALVRVAGGIGGLLAVWRR